MRTTAAGAAPLGDRLLSDLYDITMLQAYTLAGT
jgi:hypothetical protein